jgi:uncharacterized protein
MTQTWNNLLFAHWPVDPRLVQPLVPKGVEVDTCDGKAWLGLVVFRLSAVRLRFFPEVPFVASFPEINVRTYVTSDGKPGVQFLSLDVQNPIVNIIGRNVFRLAYHSANVRFGRQGDRIRFESHRKERHGFPASFSISYEPTSPVFTAGQDTLARWLTERYCYYASDRRGRTFRCDIHHPPWPLQSAKSTITNNTMALSHGIELPATEPLLHYARRMQALIWWPRIVTSSKVGRFES